MAHKLNLIVAQALVSAASTLVSTLGAAILPDTIGAAQRTSSQPITPTIDRAIWDECGFKEAETATYGSFKVTAWRLQDTTGAMAAFDWQTPSGARPSKLAKLAAETSKGLLLVHGNYLLAFDGYHPTEAELAGLAEQLKNVDAAPLPSLVDHLPAQGLVPNSERYILGPAALAKFAPAIPPSTAAFRNSAEGVLGDFQGGLKLVIFAYPNPQFAMERLPEFEEIPGAMAKRAGPMVAVVLPPANADAAERLLSLVRYQPSITLSERVPTRRDNIGDLIMNVFLLIGLLLIFCLVSGLAVGGVRTAMRRGRKGPAADPMILLHLADR